MQGWIYIFLGNILTTINGKKIFLTVLILGQLMYFVPSHLKLNNSLEVVLEYEYTYNCHPSLPPGKNIACRSLNRFH